MPTAGTGGAVAARRALAAAEVQAQAALALGLSARGRVSEALELLGRAAWLLESVPPPAPGWSDAATAVASAAHALELYETAAEQCARVARRRDVLGGPRPAGESLAAARLMLEWGTRLSHLGRAEEASWRWERCLELLQDGDPDDPVARAVGALARARLGAPAEALAAVAGLVAPARAEGRLGEARLLHLATGVAARLLGDLGSARRELVAAEELLAHGASAADRVLLHHELAELALAEQPDADPLGTLRRARLAGAERLWELRLQRLATLRLARRREQREAERSLLDQELLQDPLTSLGNRRRFDRRLEEPVADLVPRPEALVLIDVDQFKAVNDEHSHPVGDRVLREVAGVLRAHSRADDVAVRLGGDEFALFLRATAAEAQEIAERIRREIAANDWDRLSHGLRVTVSGGIAARQPDQAGAELFADADRKLYEAKRAGRNRLIA